MDHICSTGNWRASMDPWSAECRGFLPRQLRAEHGKIALKRRNTQSVYTSIFSTAFFKPGIRSLHLLFERPADLLPAGILYLEILTYLSASSLVTSLSHSLLHLSTHLLIGWMPQDFLICWLLILSTVVLPIYFP